MCVMQLTNLGAPYPGPSVVDWTGCVRIAALQHATTLGFVIGAVGSACSTSDEAAGGSLAQSLLAEPRAARLAILKAAALFVALLGSAGLATIALFAAGRIASATGRGAPIASRSSVHAALVDGAAALPVLLLIAAGSVLVALALRSPVATVVVVVAIFVLPLQVLDLQILWATPTRWIVEWLHLDPFGQGVDYIGDNSPYDQRGWPAAIGGLCIAGSICASLILSGRFLRRAVVSASQLE